MLKSLLRNKPKFNPAQRSRSLIRQAAGSASRPVIAKRFFRSDLVGVSGFNRFNLHMDPYYETRAREYTAPKKPSITVSVTGAAGNIGYALLFRIASGEMFGPNQPVYINAIELPVAMKQLEAVKMELDDCAFPLLKGFFPTSSLERGFENTDYAILLGSKPRAPGQERADLLLENGRIFQTIGAALNSAAKNTAKVFVVGNPANTNCLICAHNAPNIPPRNFSAMMRLDHDRAIAMAARELASDPRFITEFCVWGNHSPSMFPDLFQARVYGQPFSHAFGHHEFERWNSGTFVPAVQQRGAAVLKARGASSAASAANACVNHMRDWVYGTAAEGEWASMAVVSKGEYRVDDGLVFGFPVDLPPQKELRVMPDIPLSVFQENMILKNVVELRKERDAVRDLLK